jgi:hypothetical protein
MAAMETIRVLSLALILTSFAAVELRNLRAALWAYMLQALLLVAIIFVFATLHPPLFIWGNYGAFDQVRHHLLVARSIHPSGRATGVSATD